MNQRHLSGGADRVVPNVAATTHRNYTGSIDCLIRVRKLVLNTFWPHFLWFVGFFPDGSQRGTASLVQGVHSNLGANGTMEHNFLHHLWAAEAVLLTAYERCHDIGIRCTCFMDMMYVLTILRDFCPKYKPSTIRLPLTGFYSSNVVFPNIGAI